MATASFPMNSILEELRCMDGELFRSELTQRLYLLLKAQVQDALASSSRTPAQMRQFHAKILEWPAIVRDEELAVLRSKSSEIDTLFVQVAMLYVKLSHKSTENRVVRISRPRIEDLVRTFYQAVLHNPWGSSGEVWKFDPIKLDFVLRECFRKAIMESVQVVHSQAPPPAPSVLSRRDDDTEIGPDDSISNFLGEPSNFKSMPAAPLKLQEVLPAPAPPLQRSGLVREDSDSDTHSRSTRSDSSEEYNRAAPSPDAEFQRSPESRDDATIVRGQSRDDATVVRGHSRDDATLLRAVDDDAGTIRLARSASAGDAGTVIGRLGGDAGTVVGLGRSASEARTVTFQLPRGPGSVVSSVSDSSNGSRFLAAVTHKPTLMPVSEAPSLRIEFHDEDEKESSSSESD